MELLRSRFPYLRNKIKIKQNTKIPYQAKLQVIQPLYPTTLASKTPKSLISSPSIVCLNRPEKGHHLLPLWLGPRRQSPRTFFCVQFAFTLSSLRDKLISTQCTAPRIHQDGCVDNHVIKASYSIVMYLHPNPWKQIDRFSHLPMRDITSHLSPPPSPFPLPKATGPRRGLACKRRRGDRAQGSISW